MNISRFEIILYVADRQKKQRFLRGDFREKAGSGRCRLKEEFYVAPVAYFSTVVGMFVAAIFVFDSTVLILTAIIAETRLVVRVSARRAAKISKSKPQTESAARKFIWGNYG